MFGEELTFMPNLRLKIGLTLRGREGVIDLPPPYYSRFKNMLLGCWFGCINIYAKS